MNLAWQDGTPKTIRNTQPVIGRRNHSKISMTKCLSLSLSPCRLARSVQWFVALILVLPTLWSWTVPVCEARIIDGDGDPKVLPLERISIQSSSGSQDELTGCVWVEAVDGSLLFCDQLGHLHLLKKEDVLVRNKVAQADVLGEKEMEAAIEKRLASQLPDGFKILRTKHYVFCYWTSLEYAKWVSALYEKLNTGFTNFWENRGFQLEEPSHPQIVLIFANRPEYERFAKTDMGATPTGIIGYFHMLHNWVVMYDLTADGQFGNGNRNLNQVLSHPNAIPMVATIVHEATHQLMFNNGMQTRLADIPLWVSEGLAVYFEAPDLSSRKGWKGIGKINILRYQRAKGYLNGRPADSLQTLVQDDQRFRSEGMADAYAEAWAFNYFLLRRYRKEYQAYLQMLADKPAIEPVEPAQRVRELEEHLGKSLAIVDQEFVKYLQRLR